LTIDNLLRAEIVLASGEQVIASAEEHPDLFWAIRGGGGNFGVVTRFHFALHEVPQVVGGILMLPATGETLAGFMAAAEAAPEELSAVINVMPAPPMPFIPEERHGSLVIFAFMCYAGEADAGEAAMAPFRALAPAIVDMVKPMPYSGMYPPEAGGGEEYRPKVQQRTLFMDGFDRAAADVIVDRLNASDAAMRAVQLRVLGGAYERVPADATAFAHRARGILAVVVAFFGSEEERLRRRAWVDELAGRLEHGEDAAYVNFLTADDGAARIHAAYPGETWERLASVKQRYDPTNLFRVNQNVTPGAA
jgi:FAD/FMN-containing dehydrogenase